jgi:hypothetical protein
VPSSVDWPTAATCALIRGRCLGSHVRDSERRNQDRPFEDHYGSGLSRLPSSSSAGERRSSCPGCFHLTVEESRVTVPLTSYILRALAHSRRIRCHGGRVQADSATVVVDPPPLKSAVFSFTVEEFRVTVPLSL